MVSSLAPSASIGSRYSPAYGPHAGKLPEPALVAQWADELLDALDYIHTLDPPLAHGKIGLDTLVVRPDGRLALTGGGPAGATRSGDPSGDLTALAAALYTLVTGRPPTGDEQRRQALATGRPDPLLPARRLNPQTSPAFSHGLQQALALREIDRPQSAQELRDLLRQEVAEDATPSPSQRGLWLIVSAVVAGALLLGLLFLLLPRTLSQVVSATPSPSPPPARHSSLRLPRQPPIFQQQPQPSRSRQLPRLPRSLP